MSVIENEGVYGNSIGTRLLYFIFPDINRYLKIPRYKLRDWIDINKLSWYYLSDNPLALDLLKQNPIKSIELGGSLSEFHNKINWDNLSKNPNAINLLKANPDKIYWKFLLSNPNAIDILEAHSGQLVHYNPDLYWISRNPNAMDLLKINSDESPDDKFIENHAEQLTPIGFSGNSYGASFSSEKFRDKINWGGLSLNPAAIKFLKANPNKIEWWYLCGNPAAIDLLKTNPNKIDWWMLSSNPAAIDLLKNNLNKIDWGNLSRNPAAIDLLKDNQDKIDWYNLSLNSGIFIRCN